MSEVQPYIALPSPETAAALEGLLAANIGRTVLAEFVVGTDVVVRRAGTLYAVGADYVVLYDERRSASIACALSALRFVTFYEQGTQPDAQPEPQPDAQPDAQPGSITPVATRAQSQAAFNYAKRKSRKLE